MRKRWKLSTIDGAQSYTFEISPNSQDNPLPARGYNWEYHHQMGWSGRRSGRTPKQWQFSGTLLSQAHYDALLVWVGKRVKITLTDDRGDRYLIRLLSFQPVQAAGGRGNTPWRMTYTMQALVYEALSIQQFLAGAATSATTTTATVTRWQSVIGVATGTAGTTGTATRQQSVSGAASGATTAGGTL